MIRELVFGPCVRTKTLKLLTAEKKKKEKKKGKEKKKKKKKRPEGKLPTTIFVNVVFGK